MPVTRLLIALVPALVVGAANWVVVGRATSGVECVACTAWLVGAPVVLALVVAAMLPRAGTAPAVAPVAVSAPPPPPPPPEPDDTPALRLLGMLQEEGRFVDFLEEDLGPYPDEQIGAAARGIHEGCRKALGERIAFEPVLRGSEGDEVTVDAGFDPVAIRLTGNVGGAPPFRGVLRHTGWRVTRAALPARRGHDPRLIAPAEVEIP
jgi:hypothetical protein